MARILLAEDEASVREFLVRALEHAGHSVNAVEDGGAALDAFENGEFDLILADIVMPVLDGISLALKVAEIRSDVPIILMTGYAEELRRAHNLDKIVRSLISKPFTMEQIAKEVEDALRPDIDGK